MSGGDLVVIKRSGRDGMRYPLPSGCVTLGRDDDCHIRVLLPSVSPLHATVTVHRNRSVITNESSGETLVNGSSISVSALQHGDIITLGDRSLRWEYHRPALVVADGDLPQVPVKGRRKRVKRKERTRASEPAARKLEPEVKALLEMRHRTSIAGGERQVAIVQPQRREDTSGSTENNTKVPQKPAKRALRGPKAGPSTEPRKSARGTNGPSGDDALNTSRSASPKKGAKKQPEKPNEGTPKNTRHSKNTSEDDGSKISTPKKNKESSNKKTNPVDKETPAKSEAANADAIASKRTPRTPKNAPKGLDFSNVVPTDLAAVAARGTPRRSTPKGPFKHVATPRPKTPYVEPSPSQIKSKLASLRARTPRVNPLLRAAITRTPNVVKLATPKKVTPKKKIIVEKIEDPANIDDQKKSALMALTGRSPRKAPTPSVSPKYVISKASIKKISPSSTKKGKKRLSGTPKLRPGTPRGGQVRYTSAEVGGGDARGKTSMVVDGSPATRNSVQPSPLSGRTTRRTEAQTPPIIQASPRKSVLKSPSSSSPRKNESIKFDLSNLEMRSDSPPPPKSPLPKTTKRKSASDTASDDDLMLRFSSESKSPSPRRSIHSRSSQDTLESTNTTISPTKTPASARKSSRGSLMVQKVLETPIVVPSPSPSDQSRGYSRRSTLTKSQFDVTRTPENTPNASKNSMQTSLSKTPRTTRQKVMESYSIVDLVSIDSTRSIDETDTSTDYDSASSVNSTYQTPSAKSARTASRGRSLANLSLETSTPVINRSSRLSTRKMLLKSATIASAIKRSRSTPITTKKQSPRNSPTKTPKRSKSLTLSPDSQSPKTVVDETIDKRSSRSKSGIIIDDSAISNTTLTQSPWASKTATPTSGRSPRSSKTYMTGASNQIDESVSMSNTSTPTRLSIKSRQSPVSPSPALSRSSSRSRQTPKGASPRSSKSLTPGSKRKLIGNLSTTRSSESSPTTESKRKSLGNLSTTRSSEASPTPRSKRKSTGNLSITRSLESSPTPGSKKKSTGSLSTSISSESSPTPGSKKKSIGNLSHTRSSESSPSPGSKKKLIGNLSHTRSSESSLSSGSKKKSTGNLNTTRSLESSPTPGSKKKSIGNLSHTRSSESSPSPGSKKKSTGNLNTTRSLESSPTPRSKKKSTGNLSTNRSLESSPTPGSKKSTGNLSTSKRRTTRGKPSPKLQTDLDSSEKEGPRTPENDISLDEAGTPVLNIQDFLNESQEKINQSLRRASSVKEAVKRFEAISTPKTVEKPRKITRKTLGGIGERILARRSDLEAQNERKAWSDPRKKGKGITKSKTGDKANLSALKKVLSKATERSSDENSVSSDKTDENAPKPDNEIVITPKSSIQLVPEAIKGQHSTAKKSTSRKSIIDHLNESQEIVKQLFNSPVKRKLSQSMTHYTSQLNETSSRSRRSTLARTPNSTFDFDSVKTPRVPTEVFVSPMDTPMPPSPNLIGVKRLYAKNSPKNDLTNVRGLRNLLKTPGAKKSPRNDLTNISGVKELLGSTRKRKSPKDDLTNVAGVKKLLGTARKQNSPKNDLTQVAGVKQLFASGSKKQKSPKNDLRNIAGVKKLLATPKGTQRSPKNDLTDVRGVKSVFQSDRSVRNALEDISGIEELFKSNSSLKEQRTPVKTYGSAKSVSNKKRMTSARKEKYLNADVSRNNVEEWLDNEIEKRTNSNSTSAKKTNKKLSTSLQSKTPKNLKKKSPPKSSKLDRALKKLTIDAVGGDIVVTPDRRSRRAITVDKSTYSIEVAKALTPPKKKSEERISLPFKKRGHSSNKSKSPRKTEPDLDNSTQALGLDKDKSRISLPIKKRMIRNHAALGTSTPVKKRRPKADDGDSVDLGPVSPIESSPNATPRKSTSLQEARRTVEQASLSIRSAQKGAKSDSIQEPKVTKKVPRGRKQKASEPATSSETTEVSSPVKPAPKTRAKRGTKTSPTKAKITPKKATRGRRVQETPSKSPKLVISKKEPKKSPQKPAAKTTRGRKPEVDVSDAQSPEPAPKSRQTRKGQKDQETVATLVVVKKGPKLSPQKPVGTARTARSAAQETNTKKASQKNSEPTEEKASPKKTRGRKTLVVQADSPKKTRGRKTATPEAQPESPKKTRGRKTSASDEAESPKKTRGRKAVAVEVASPKKSDTAPSRRKRGGQRVQDVESPKKKVVRGRAAKITEEERPKRTVGKAQPDQKKAVSFAPETEETAPRRAGSRRKAETPVEDEGKPQAKRGRGRGSAAPPASKPARSASGGRRSAAKAPSPKTTRARPTRQRK